MYQTVVGVRYDHFARGKIDLIIRGKKSRMDLFCTQRRITCINWLLSTKIYTGGTVCSPNGPR
jgi:hypothetical protein